MTSSMGDLTQVKSRDGCLASARRPIRPRSRDEDRVAYVLLGAYKCGSLCCETCQVGVAGEVEFLEWAR